MSQDQILIYQNQDGNMKIMVKGKLLMVNEYSHINHLSLTINN